MGRLGHTLSTLRPVGRPTGRKTRFRLLARLYRVGSTAHWVPPKGFFDASYIAFLLSQAYPGASTRRSAIHEEASVKTGARRLRDCPDIHSASAAQAERHEKVCGCSHSHQRRRIAPCRTPGCNLSPALDLDLRPLDLGGRDLPAIGCSLYPVLRQARITIAWRSGVRLCRRATGRGISRPTVCQWCIGPLDGDVIRGRVFVAI